MYRVAVAAVFVVFLAFPVHRASGSASDRIPLRTNSSGRFRIVQFADMHFGEGEDTTWGPAQDKISLLVMRSVIQSEASLDLAVLSGDQLTGLNIDDNATDYWDMILEELRTHTLPHTAILGNHDAEPYSASGGSNQSAPGAKTNRTALILHDMKDDLSYSELGPVELRPAVSIFVTKVLASENDSVVLQLVHLDSGGGGMIEEVYPAQIAWLNDTILSDVPALVFVHIPVAEFADAITKSSNCFGDHDDGITPTVTNNGLFAALEAKEEVKGIFVGHDHLNDFCCKYGAPRPMGLCFGRHSGAGGYSEPGYQYGARVIDVSVSESKTSIHTYVRLANGSVTHSGDLLE